MSDRTLVPLDQKIIDFYDDELVAIRADDGRVYVSVRHLVDALGLDPTGQIRRMRRHTVLEKGLGRGDILSPRDGRPRTANFLRVDLVPLYLAGVSTKAVAEDIRPKLEKYQEEAAAVLWEAFQEGRLTTVDVGDLIATTDALTDAEEALQIAKAVYMLARNQVTILRRLDESDRRHNEIDRRLASVEDILGDSGRHITPDQASQISQSVKAIGLTLTKRSGRNEYGAVYGELYRRYGVTSYKALPESKFDDALHFLTQWHNALTDDADVAF